MRLFEMVRTLSQLKDKEGRFLLGYVYRHLAECEGIKPAENFKKAFKCFSDDILKDFQPALLGKALTYLNIPNSNEELYIKYLSEAAKAEDTDCLKKIRNLIRSLNLKIDDPDDRALFKDCVKFVRTSKAKSLFLAGGISLLPHDSENEEITYSGIFDWFVEAADIGDEMSEMLLGYYHAAGFYLEPNKKMALKYLGRALRKGNTQASAIIAVILENDEFPPRDLKKFDEYLTNQDDRHFTLLRKTVENRNKKSKKKRADEDLPPQSPRRRGLYCSDAVERSARPGKRNDAEELFSNPDFCLKAADLGLGEAQLQVGLTRLESAVSESEKRKAFDIIEKAQKNGAAESDAHLGWLLINGVGTKRDFKKGHGLLERGCSSGSPLALYRMGRALFEGLGVPKDLLAAENYFFEAADNDNAEAALKLAEMYHNGLGSKTDRFKSLACLYKAAILGNADAQYRYGRAIMPKSRLSGLVCDVGAARGDFAYDVFNSSVNGLFENTPPAAKPPRRNGNSRNGRSVSKESHSRNLRTILNMEEVDLLASVEIAPEFSDAILFLQSAAEKNHPLALLRLGECLLTGTDIERDVESAIAYFEAAADEGAIEAHSYLGLASLFGVGRPSDVPKAIKHFKVAGQHGSAFAQTMLGEIYANPRHGINEVKEGLRWYRRAAAKNNPYTWYLLAELCHRGENLEPDLFKALKFHEKADAAGDAASRFQIYVLLSENPLNPSPEIVEKHLLESAKRGSTDALFVLAKLFQTGRVFEQNVKLAVDSHKLASDGGHDGSMVELGKMSLAGTAGTAGIDGSDAALEYFLEAERLGNPEATYLIGKMSAEGLAGLPRDPRRAFERYRKAAALGQRDALFEIGKFRAGEELSPEEFRLKVDCLEKAARFGQPGAVTIMGDLVREGRLGAPDPGKALRLYEYAASLEEPEALYRLGLLSLEAKEDKDRLKKAFDFFLRASAKNHAPSQFCLHVFLDEGLLGKKDEAGAMKYLELAAENGSGDAQRELGLRFLRGVSVEKDVSEALKWLGKAEENGDGRASRVIADTLFKGEGVKADPAKAVKHYESAADKGDGGAQYALAMICLKGSAGFRDPDKAFRLFNLAKDRGYPRSFYYLGVMAEKGEGTPKDPRAALDFHEKGAAAYERLCFLRLACHHLVGEAGQPNLPLAAEWLKKAESSRDPEVLFRLGLLSEKGIAPTGSGDDAVNRFKAAAAMGHAGAQFKLARMCDSGAGLEKDRRMALAWCREAALSGSPDAMFALGSAFLEGADVPRDEGKAMALFFEGAEKHGHPKCLFALGTACLFGEGLEADAGLAVKHYVRAWRAGEVEAGLQLGNMFRHGTGVPVDKGKALRWHERAWNAGCEPAGLELAAMLSGGEGVEKNPEKAAKIYAELAEKNDLQAIPALGLMFAEGRGVEKNLAKALELFEKGAALGSRRAGSLLEKLARDAARAL